MCYTVPALNYKLAYEGSFMSFPKFLRGYLFFAILFFTACGLRVDPTPIPVQSPTPSVPVTAEGFSIINYNYWLGSPDGDTFLHFDNYNNPGSVDGESNKWPVAMEATEGNLGIYIQGAAGEFGLSYTINLTRGCYGVKLGFDAHLHDRRHSESHVAAAAVYFIEDDILQNLNAKKLPMTTTSEHFFVFFIESYRQVKVFGYYQSLFATPGDNSMVNLKYFQIIELPGGYCL